MIFSSHLIINVNLHTNLNNIILDILYNIGNSNNESNIRPFYLF